MLVGHSYGGMVATGVADRARDRVTQLIYIDAFVPGDGQSLLDLNEAERQRMQELTSCGELAGGRRTRSPPDTSPADQRMADRAPRADADQVLRDRNSSCRAAR